MSKPARQRLNRRSGALSANPALVGAVAVLVTVVGVYLAYNANRGLPFVPSRHLRLQLANGATLNRDQEVREGGFRIGIVEGLRPVVLPNGHTGAEVSLKLDKAAGSIPVDSRFTVRARGVAGAKYIEVTRGFAARTFPDDGVVPVAQTRTGLDLDEAIAAFDAPTRAGVRRVLRGLGDGLASRGADVQVSIGRLPGLLGTTARVMADLADPGTDLHGLIRGLRATTGALAPVAPQQADAVGAMADTFAALAHDRGALDATLAQAPPTIRQANASLAADRPLLRHTAALMAALVPVSARLRSTVGPIDAALRGAAGPLRRSPSLSKRLRDALVALRRTAADDATTPALRAMTATVATLQPQLRFYGPWITVCQIPQQWLEFVPDVLSVPSSTGTAQRGLVDTTTQQHDDLSTMGANEFATGRGAPSAATAQQLHANFFVNAVDDHGDADCAAGQSGYLHGANPYDTTSDHYYSRAVVETPPGDPLGPLWGSYDAHGKPLALGPRHVPPGETFTVRPGGRAAKEIP